MVITKYISMLPFSKINKFVPVDCYPDLYITYDQPINPHKINDY